MGWALAISLGTLLAAGSEEALDAGAAAAAEPATEQTQPAPEAAPVEAVAAPDPAPAVSAEPDAPHTVETTGYVLLRGTYNRARLGWLLPTDDQPQRAGLLELNGQVKVNVSRHTFVSSDLSLVGQLAGDFRGRDLTGEEVELAAHDTAAARPFLSINELYLLHEVRPELNLLIGKKRLTWGSGFAYNPTDVLNLRKDPTDPTGQRSGVWLARVEVPLEYVTFSAVFAPSVLKAAAGIPYQFLTWPEWDQQDGQAHYQAILRMYALLFDSDLNVMLMYGNRFNDVFEKKFRVGASFSRYFFTDYELHVEALFQSGSTRDFANGDCLKDTSTVLGCVIQGTPFVEKKLLNDPALRPRVLVGARRQFSDDSLLSLEYLYQADGYSREQFQDYVSGLDFAQQALAMGIPPDKIPTLGSGTGAAVADGVPQRFSFEPIGKHYLFATFQKPRIHDDFTAQLVVITSLQDLSTVWTPSISWSVTEWLTLSALGFLPLPGPEGLAATRPSSGAKVSEYSVLPIRYRFTFEARVFY
ncbi:MAG: hypothetical protein K1X89_11135 [Myxococcaceae bacterium]|nr:hypothetical protein [Myxococcaceae bacterium]